MKETLNNAEPPTITYTPCYMQCGFNLKTLIRELNLFVLFLCGVKLKFEYLYIE